MPNVIITGCNSDIGHAFAQLLIKEVHFLTPALHDIADILLKGWNVYATDAEPSERLRMLKCHTNLVDVLDLQSIHDFRNHWLDTRESIDLLLNVAGTVTYHDKDSPEKINEDFKMQQCLSSP